MNNICLYAKKVVTLRVICESIKGLNDHFTKKHYI